ncbi:Hypothetical predicted protein [Mytilus galloprovincialis]|uniref:Uncharacterized protein n=1 Tax=Mytilus galloprovincialis TaxID=29158 RepID=A0A8B6HK96_MYTGA|nr:Hypothetical predicted protein [Mytilus galloprovincialis]
MEQHIVLDEESDLWNNTLYWMKSRIYGTTHCIRWRVRFMEQRIVMDEESELLKNTLYWMESRSYGKTHRQEVSVWIVGSSLIRNAFVHARSKTGGVNLGLHRIGVKIWWQGYGGTGLKDLESTIKD